MSNPFIEKIKAMRAKKMLSGKVVTKEVIEEPKPDFATMTVKELRDYATERNIGLKSTKKADIINELS